MRILFDFLHPVDINFFKYAIEILRKDGHDIFLIYRERGPIQLILQKEFSEYKIKKIGVHKNGFIRKVIGQLRREIDLLLFLNKNKIELALSFGPSLGLSCKIKKIPFLSFADDPEYKLTLQYARLFATKLIMPKLENLPKDVITYVGYKELSYLHPKYYKPKMDDLEEYGLKVGKYVFIREVANTSLNYIDKESFNIEIISKIKSKGLDVVMSLEDKTLLPIYSNDCIILKEPLNDIHAIIKNALFLISSGDTIARESVLLNTPCIYIGGRDMRANHVFIKKGVMFKIEEIEKINQKIDDLYSQSKNGTIKCENIDRYGSPTDIILEEVSDYIGEV